MKADLISYVAATCGMTKKDAAEAVDAVFGYITEEVAAGNKVGISGFGSWTVKDRAERPGRNPQTGEQIVIPASKAVTFKAGKALKEAVK